VDVGSTTVKAVVVEVSAGCILWRDYRRHDTRQAEMLSEFLLRMESEIGIAPGNCRIFITGSGGSALAAPIGARFVQEVNAVALAVEKMHPEAQSVIELGGQDAKIILFKTENGTGRRRKIASMNDKCAGGTGAVIDKIQAKLKITADELPHLAYRGVRIHPVAGKCGVFAETDINGLQKQGVPPAELMASLFDAIVLQNLTVLTRGHTLLPHVLLLGGPNAFLRGMREAWQHNIPLLWKERGIELPPGQAVEDLIQVPPDALYFAALGAVEFGMGETEEKGLYLGCAALERFLDAKRQQRKITNGKPGLCASIGELRNVSARRTGRGFYRPRWRFHVHQGGASVNRRRGAGQGLSALRGQPDYGCHRGAGRSAPPGGRGLRRKPEDARRGNNRLRQGYSATGAQRRRGPG
jgi:activator of 2-hydroxyglutaryl-CoA dehydratase